MPEKRRLASARAIWGLGIGLAVTVMLLLVIWQWRVAREEARGRLCRDVLAGYGRALAAYAADHDGWLPFESIGREADGHIVWFDALAPYMAGAERVCPSVDRTEQNHDEAYRMNSQLAQSNPLKIEGYRRLDSLSRPEATIVLFEGEYGGQKRSLKGKMKDVSFRHNGQANLLLADWSVRSFSRTQLEQASHGLPPEILWQPPPIPGAAGSGGEGKQ